MHGDEGQRLPGVGRVGQRLLGQRTRLSWIAVGVVVLRPEQGPFGSTKHSTGPVQPAIVRLQPGTGRGKVLRVQGECGGGAKQRHGGEGDDVSRFGSRPVAKKIG